MWDFSIVQIRNSDLVLHLTHFCGHALDSFVDCFSSPCQTVPFTLCVCYMNVVTMSQDHDVVTISQCRNDTMSSQCHDVVAMSWYRHNVTMSSHYRHKRCDHVVNFVFPQSIFYVWRAIDVGESFRIGILLALGEYHCEMCTCFCEVHHPCKTLLGWHTGYGRNTRRWTRWSLNKSNWLSVWSRRSSSAGFEQ